MDNVFIKRLWRRLRYECVHLLRLRSTQGRTKLVARRLIAVTAPT